MTYADWSPGQPDGSYGGLERCLEYEAQYDLHWNDDECEDHDFFICERPSVKTGSHKISFSSFLSFFLICFLSFFFLSFLFSFSLFLFILSFFCFFLSFLSFFSFFLSFFSFFLSFFLLLLLLLLFLLLFILLHLLLLLLSLLSLLLSSLLLSFAYGAMGRRIDPSWWTH